MKCSECSMLLDDYLDKELDSKNSIIVETHLVDCASCSREFQLLEAEQNLFDHYLSNIKASPQMWMGLQQKLEKAQSPIYRRPSFFHNLFSGTQIMPQLNALQVAAVMIVLVLGIAGLIKYQVSGNSSEQNYTALQKSSADEDQATERETGTPNVEADDNVNPKEPSIGQKPATVISAIHRQKNIGTNAIPRRINPATTSKTIDSALKRSTEQIVPNIERKYLNAIAVLTDDIKRRREEGLLQIRTELGDLDRTIENTRRAVREQPQNPVAVQYMTDAYAKKVELLRDVLNK